METKEFHDRRGLEEDPSWTRPTSKTTETTEQRKLWKPRNSKPEEENVQEDLSWTLSTRTTAGTKETVETEEFQDRRRGPILDLDHQGNCRN